jgi:hypothetical protein
LEYGCSYSVKNSGVEVTFNGMISLLNGIKIYQLVQKLTGGQTDTQITDRMVISLTYIFISGKNVG